MNCFDMNKLLIWRLIPHVLVHFIVLNCGYSYAQIEDSLWRAYEDRNIDSSITLYTHKIEKKFKVEFSLKDQDTIIIREYNEATDGVALNNFLSSHTLEPLWIQYLNDSTWYVFGNHKDFALFPYIYRTTNAGLSWETIFESWPEKLNLPSISSMFHMYDINHGIWLVGLNKNWVDYRTTSDGGYTWQDRRFRVRREYIKIGKHVKTSLNIIHYSTKIKLDATTVFRRGNVYESRNKGKKFKKMH